MSRARTKHPKPKRDHGPVVKAADVYCLCNGADDGSPMVSCSECDGWYHFTCVDLSEEAASDINVYICPPCTAKTGQRTVMLWEGPEALEDVSSAPARASKPKPPPKDDPAPASESDPDTDEDEYVVKHRRARRVSVSSDSDSDVKPKKQAPLKRKAPKSSQPPAKRKKNQDSGARDDPARSFCLGKLETVFRDIFVRYPHVNSEEKKPGELSAAENAQLEEDAKQFAADLEQCVYDEYSEPDKAGRLSAAAKYKDRYRMLQFNLSKVDRTVLHRRIASGGITPREISLMSSTDLANEQMQQSMKLAEQEAFEHSILEKTTAIPRAKLTHKGFEDIEDLDNVSNAARELELDRDRQRAEEEKRERERAARLRVRTLSMSVQPESPATPVSAAWDAPPPNSLLRGSVMSAIESVDPSFVSELGGEPEMNLADLINIDDETPPPVGPSSPKPAVSDSIASPTALTTPLSPTATTGISPFTTLKPEHRASFDLSSLWTAPKKADSPPVPEGVSASAGTPPLPEADKKGDAEAMDIDDETDDRDFDMFLEEKEPAAPLKETVRPSFDALPQVWSGKINMPLDSTIPQETPVNARQVGGRQLDATSVLWKTLFPSDLLRIDGRVPVDKSSQFLLQTRMNSAKELIAVAFTPESPAAGGGFQQLMDFLIAKVRHGLVFPWGSRPKEHHPGKELYIIPLLATESLPDYMELFDNLHLPKIRSENLLVGVWVLNKGKLAPPPTPIVAPSPPTTSLSPPTMTTTVPPPPAAPTTFEPSALAAEVAQLTPEQVRLMLQSLTGAIPGVGVGLPGQPPPVQRAMLPPQMPPQAMPPPSWPPYAPPPPQYGHPHYQQPPLPQPQHGPGHMSPYGAPPPPQPEPQYQRASYDREPGYDRGSGGGNWNGHNNSNNNNNRNRGRGRGGGGGGGAQVPSGPVDSGWPRRQGQGPGRWP
ncbi:Transcription elongation regulator [Mycena kentingensis (nom. inval.)]|nr:Transcription elongation regulator [Mycena kentingensis (nom. inval.)]